MRDLKVLLELILLISLPVLLPSGKVYGRTANQMRHSRQEPGGSVNEAEVQVLIRGKPIRRELSGGEEQSYRITLISHLFLKVVVEQKGIDAVVVVSGPDGKEILEFDSESRPEGLEEASLVAEATGDFRLTVRSGSKGAVTGSYEIRVEELRIATENDRALHDARKQYLESLKLQRAGKYDEALLPAEHALEIRERLLGAEHREVAAAINNLADIYTDKGEYVQAESLYLRALAIREKTLGKDHPDTAHSLSNLAGLYQQQGKYVEAVPLLQRALAIRDKALDKDHPDISASLSNLAVLYKQQGKYVEAEPLLQRALAIDEKALGEAHPYTATSLSNLAGLYFDQGKYLEAEPLFQRALAIREKALGNDHPDTALSLNSLATLYVELGKYAEAEPLFRRALDIREKTLGKDHLYTANSLNNLAILYQEQGKHAEAEPLYRRALTICEKLGNHPRIARGLNNLAQLYRAQGKYAEAEPLLQRALEIGEKVLGKAHPDTGASLNNLAQLYLAQGKYAEAELLFRRALELWEKVVGKDHPYTAHSLSSLAELYYRQGKYLEAEPLYQRALAIREKVLGKDHPETAASFDNLAVLFMAKGDYAQAVKFQSLANAASESNLARNLVIGSERTKMTYTAIFSQQTDRTISLHLHAPADPVARNLAATLVLQRKGRALDATSQNLNALRSRFNAEDQRLLDRLTETRSQIARLVLREPQKTTLEQHQARLKELETQADKDEVAISRRSSEFRAQYLPVTLEGVRAAIPPAAALIEYASYRPFNAGSANHENAYGQPRYVAFVLRRQGQIESRDLGEAKAIDRAMAALRQALRNPARLDVKRLARALDAQVFRPLRPLLGGARQLLISPDGSLNLIPFPALVDERGHYAVERYTISYLTSGRDLLRLQVERESKDGPLLVAGPDFGRRSQTLAMRSGNQERTAAEWKEKTVRSALEDLYFQPLPGAAEEGEALRALLPGATLLTKHQATKAALNQTHSPRLLHIATHGFFLEDQEVTTSTGKSGYQPLIDSPKRFLEQAEQSGLRIENPLLRSGLVLAGANEHKEDDNGILTALEVTGLNLWGTKLVVLSACDTGVGDVKNRDGVYGLRRALVLAGAETQIMSLWPVADRATRELMVSYYRKLQQGKGRGEALREVQLEMLKRADRRHPFYWASFIQSGEWASLDRP